MRVSVFRLFAAVALTACTGSLGGHGGDAGGIDGGGMDAARDARVTSDGGGVDAPPAADGSVVDAGTRDMPGADPCAGITCDGHGSCVSGACSCDSGYHSVGATSCVVDTATDPCMGVACSGHGTCGVVGGAALCTCDTGYHVAGASCVSDTGPDPCAGVTCGGHGTCEADRGVGWCHCDTGYYSRISPTSCELITTGSVCDGVSCGHGSCLSSGIGFATCQCDPGFQEYGLACSVERRLYCRNRDDTLAPRGTARCSADDLTVEVCRDSDGDGLVEWAFGLTCDAGTTCSGGCLGASCPDHPCPLGQVCLPSTHGMPVNICVTACDCENCGNCGTTGTFVGSQAFCGNPAGSPATTACTAPCPNAGDGCIPGWTDSAGHPVGLCYPIEGCFSSAP